MNRQIKISQLPQVSAQAEAVKHTYKKLTGKSGKTWLVPIGRFAADSIHVSENKHTLGYAGATLKFNLEDGSVCELKAPWHAGATGLLLDTGYDTLDKHATKVIIATTVKYEPGEFKPTLCDILFEDEGFQEGVFSRGTDLAIEFANRLGRKVYYHVETGGGSHSGWQSPEKK